MDQDQIAQAIRDAFAIKTGVGGGSANAGEALNEIANQLTRIADALEQLVELEQMEEYDDEDDED
jgi:hypothetical protein